MHQNHNDFPCDYLIPGDTKDAILKLKDNF